MHDGSLRIVPAAEEHREALRAACAQDREIWDIYPNSFLGGSFDRQFDAFFTLPNSVPFVIFDGGELIGMSSFLNVDSANHVLEIGRTYYVPRVRGTGLNRRIKTLMLDRAFGEGFTRIEFRVDTRNARSMAAVEKIGGKREGVLRKNRITWTGFVRDTAIFAILADEWRRG